MKRLAIIGGGKSKKLFNHRNDTDVWTIPVAVPEHNDIADRCFELHDYHVFKKVGRLYLDDLRALKCPLYMQGVHPSFPTAVKYPIESMIAEHGKRFSSTVSYMLAMAIDEGYEHITLYGVDLDKEEYRKQKSYINYFVGFARGKGIIVVIHNEDEILGEKLYGYEI